MSLLKISFFNIAVILSGSLAQASVPVIETIEGDKVVVVKTPKGNKIGIKGTVIDFGDRIKTGPRATAKIRYPDGSKLLIGRNTEMEVVESKNGIPTSEIHAGEVRGLIKKQTIGTNGGRPKFIMKTRAAVMGVRGTDFVYGVNEAAKAELRTLDGIVEIAKDENALLDGSGIRVRPNQMITADQGQITAPQAFDRAAYVAQLKNSQPDFLLLSKGEEVAEVKSQIPQEELVKDIPFFRFKLFQGAGLYARQKSSSGNVISGSLAWTPRMKLIWPFYLRAHVGVVPMKYADTKSILATFEVGAMAGIRLPLIPIEGDIGPIASVWSDQVKASPGGMITGSFIVDDFGFLERIFVSATFIDLKPRDTTVSSSGLQKSSTGLFIIRAGIGFQF